MDCGALFGNDSCGERRCLESGSTQRTAERDVPSSRCAEARAETEFSTSWSDEAAPARKHQVAFVEELIRPKASGPVCHICTCKTFVKYYAIQISSLFHTLPSSIHSLLDILHSLLYNLFHLLMCFLQIIRSCRFLQLQGP